MRSRPVSRGGRRTRLKSLGVPTVAAVLVVVAMSGCGGSDDAPPSIADYYGAMNGFCASVSTAARAVSTTSAIAAKAPAATRFNRISAALKGFADATETALGKLEDTGAPARFAEYRKANAAGFRRYIFTLRTAAEDPRALAKLRSRVSAIQLPDPPRDLTDNAKSCASFSPAG